MPELVSQNGKLRGTIVLADERRRLRFNTGICALQRLRYFYGPDAVAPPDLPGSASTPPSATPPKHRDPAPGPTLRARVGDIVQLTFLNQVDAARFGNSLDRGDNAGACDESTGTPGYPQSAKDEFPNCFHGSSTGNIHFHGTHTNPNSTGDNVFLNVRPSPRRGGAPTVTFKSVEYSFNKFFADCDHRLKSDVLSEWPYTWNDLPATWTQQQRELLRAHDKDKPDAQKLWPENQRQIDAKRWPQYYVGAFPYCFQLPEWPSSGGRLKMGQAPGIHWYHAHKHGSTALNVANGMTGAFVIEGKYDDELNAFYGTDDVRNWTRTQPVLVINQLGVTPNLARGALFGPQNLSVNGQFRPRLTMRRGEVQLWRIVNTSSRSFANFVAPSDRFEWRQLAQDGVQFTYDNYRRSHNTSFLIAPGNRVDLLVKAPMNPSVTPYNVMVQDIVTRTGLTLTSAPPVVLMSVAVLGDPPEFAKRREFIETKEDFPKFPEFLADITDKEVKFSRTLTFHSKAQGEKHQHTIDGEPFSDKIGASVLLNTVEEWKVQNTTVSDFGSPFTNIDHPFHIHINPFQVVEVFDPNEVLVDADGNSLQDADGNPFPKYVFDPAAKKRDEQCLLDPRASPINWKPCGEPKTKRTSLPWSDVYPIPSGKVARNANREIIKDADDKPIIIPGYFKMRSRFVDYPGLYVMHCHILAHEDRGMMTIVEVRPSQSPMKHH